MKIRFLKDASLVIVAEGVAGISGLVYLMVTSRQLGRADYGLLQGIMGFYGVLMILGVPLNLAFTHCVASCDSSLKRIVAGKCIRTAAVLGATYALMVGIAAQPISTLLRTESVLPVLCMAALIGARVTILGFYGALQGSNRYVAYSLARVVEPAACLACGSMLVIAGAGVTGALCGYLAGMILVLVIFVLQRNLYELSPGGLNLLLRELGAIGSIFCVFAVLFFVGDFPSVLARAILPDELGGTYASLYTLRHLLLPLCSSVCYPLYSHTASKSGERGLLFKALTLVVLLGIVFLMVSKLCPALVFHFLYGDEFVDGARYMFAYGVALCLQTVAMVLMLHYAAGGRLRRPLLLLPLTVFAAYLLTREIIIQDLIYSQAAAWIALLLGAILWQVLSPRHSAGSEDS